MQIFIKCYGTPQTNNESVSDNHGSGSNRGSKLWNSGSIAIGIKRVYATVEPS